MARQLDFYFDCSSPWTYLAFHAVQPLAAELGAEIAWKPILVGGVFNAADHLEPDATYVSTNFENELFARYGNSTGQGEHDWHITNVTDNGLAGASASAGRFNQAGSDPHGYPREPMPPHSTTTRSSERRRKRQDSVAITRDGSPGATARSGRVPAHRRCVTDAAGPATRGAAARRAGSGPWRPDRGRRSCA